LPDERLGVCHSVHILDSPRRQVNAGARMEVGQFLSSRLTSR
jgi:hypothetical protein